ncbi:MAG: hypothetical protein ACHQJ6_03445 [Candidatus Berkiellales bacterium]
MLNPMFAFIERYPRVQDYLKKKFNFSISLEDRTFDKSKQRYWLMRLPLPKVRQLNLNGSTYQVTDHHFTIPFDEDSNQSQYHYTLELSDEKKSKYKVRLFFDKLDHITVEPKIVDITDGEPSFKFAILKAQDQESIIDLCMPSTDVVLFLREQQKKTIGVLAKAKQQYDNELVELSIDLVQNKEKYFGKAKSQIQLISDMEAIGCPVFSAQRRFIERFVEELPRATVDAMVLAEPVPLSLGSSTLQEKKESKPSAGGSTSLPQSARSLPPLGVSSTKARSLNLKKSCEVLIQHYDLVENKQEVKDELIHEIIKKVQECKAEELIADEESKTELLKLIVNLSDLIKRFFDQVPLLPRYQVYLQAVTANLVLLNDAFVETVVKEDNVEALSFALKLNLLRESTKYALRKGEEYTLIEWCVLYHSVKCFKALLNQRFSLNYISSYTSPLSLLLEDLATREEFFSEVQEVLFSRDAHRLFNKLITLLEQQLVAAQGDELALLQIRIEMMKPCKGLFSLFEKKPHYRAKFLSYRSTTPKFDVEESIKLRSHVNFMRALCGVMKEGVTFLVAILDNPHMMGFLNLNDKSTPPENVALPFDLKIRLINLILYRITDRYRLLNEIIRSKEPLDFSKNPPRFKRNNEETRDFQERLKALDDQVSFEKKVSAESVDWSFKFARDVMPLFDQFLTPIIQEDRTELTQEELQVFQNAVIGKLK